MTTCRRCGAEFARYTVADIHCDRCVREVARLTAPRPQTWAPEWRRRMTARDETGALR